MKYLLLIIFVSGSFTFTSCSKAGPDQVEVRFINSTGMQLTDITVNSVPVGDMSVGETTEYYRINGFMQDTGMPDAQFTATTDNKRVTSTAQFYWCATEKSRLEPGLYTVRVRLVNYSNGEYFQLTFE